MTVRVLAMKDGTTAEDHRLGLSVFMAGAGAAALDRRSGVVPYVGSCDLTGVSPMVGRLSPFAAWVDGTSNSLQGGYPVIVDANTDLTHDNGEAGNSRVDRYVLQIRDNPYDSSGQQDGRVVIVKGQAGGAANAVPASSLLLWEVTVPANASIGGGGFTMSSARTDRRTYTSALGGLIIVATSTERDLTTPYEGLHIWRVDGKAPQIYTGGGWRWIGTVICSSASNRDTLVPSGERYTGQQIYRSDTGLHEIWDGSTWTTTPRTRYILKGVNTPRTSTTSLADDVGTSGGLALSASVVSGGVYDVEFVLMGDGAAAGDIKTAWNVPATTTGLKAIIGPTDTSADFTSRTNTKMRMAAHGPTTSVTLSMQATDNGTAWVERGVIVAGGNGNVTLQWAQGTSSLTATILYGQSFMRITRIA